MVDTGATIVVLSYEDAERAGIFLNPSDFTQAVTTANGVARIAPVTLDRVTIGDITVRNVPAAVAEPGRLKTSLLGMSFLSRLSRFDMRSDVLVLTGVDRNSAPFSRVLPATQAWDRLCCPRRLNLQLDPESLRRTSTCCLARAPI